MGNTGRIVLIWRGFKPSVLCALYLLHLPSDFLELLQGGLENYEIYLPAACVDSK